MAGGRGQNLKKWVMLFMNGPKIGIKFGFSLEIEYVKKKEGKKARSCIKKVLQHLEFRDIGRRVLKYVYQKGIYLIHTHILGTQYNFVYTYLVDSYSHRLLLHIFSIYSKKKYVKKKLIYAHLHFFSSLSYNSRLVLFEQITFNAIFNIRP